MSRPGTGRLSLSQPIKLRFRPRTQRDSVIYHQLSVLRHTCHEDGTPWQMSHVKRQSPSKTRTGDPPGDANHQLPFPRGIIHVRCFYLERLNCCSKSNLIPELLFLFLKLMNDKINIRNSKFYLNSRPLTQTHIAGSVCADTCAISVAV